jgi:hypothetical protein
VSAAQVSAKGYGEGEPDRGRRHRRRPRENRRGVTHVIENRGDVDVAMSM